MNRKGEARAGLSDGWWAILGPGVEWSWGMDGLMRDGARRKRTAGSKQSQKGQHEGAWYEKHDVGVLDDSDARVVISLGPEKGEHSMLVQVMLDPICLVWASGKLGRRCACLALRRGHASSSTALTACSALINATTN